MSGVRQDERPAAAGQPPAEPAPGPEPAAGPAQPSGERNGPKGPEPTRFGDWERDGRCTDF